MITKDEIHRMFTYDNRGYLVRRLGSRAGQRAGTTHSSGYRRVTVNGKKMREHRLVFLLHHGYIPTHVDHVNGERADNRIENLRAATSSQNQWNRAVRNSGVHWMTKRLKWRAKVRRYGRDITIGYYDSKDEAIKAMCVFKEAHDEGFTR